MVVIETERRLREMTPEDVDGLAPISPGHPRSPFPPAPRRGMMGAARNHAECEEEDDG